MRLLKTLLVLYMCAAGPAVAGPLEDANAAFKAGDYATAAAWYRKAAEQGDAGAQSMLAFMYELGKGVPHNLVQAHMWFNLAAASGTETAAKLRDNIAYMMTPAQIAEAQKLAREWKLKQ